jgi:NAD(P)-dependent dehydrogenase (short-subunit alcohol dehydrogenase family)
VENINEQPMIALITGGGRGIGRGIALRLAKEGWDVAISARSADQLTETASLAKGRVLAFAGDVADPAAVRALVQEVEAKLGAIDLLINNAGTGGPFGRFWETDPEAWWRCQEVNLRGPMLCCRAVLPGMIGRRAGRIVNVASGAGCQAFPDMSAYVASKTGLIRFSEQLALELDGLGVSVFPIRPGVLRTAMVEEARHRLPFIQKLLDDGAEVSPDQVASLVLALASGRADVLSGRLFSVHENVDDIVSQAEAVRARELYLLRMQKLYHRSPAR